MNKILIGIRTRNFNQCEEATTMSKHTTPSIFVQKNRRIDKISPPLATNTKKSKKSKSNVTTPKNEKENQQPILKVSEMESMDKNNKKRKSIVHECKTSKQQKVSSKSKSIEWVRIGPKRKNVWHSGGWDCKM